VQALEHRPITVYGEGQQTRSFCYVSDLVEGIVRVARGSRLDRPVNLGNPGEFTVLELAKAVIELTNSRSEIVFRPLPADDPRQRCPDIGRARELYGFEPNVALKAGLSRTIEEFRVRLASPPSSASPPPR
jgi:UDP-glucuronate decarboxylase